MTVSPYVLAFVAMFGITFVMRTDQTIGGVDYIRVILFTYIIGGLMEEVLRMETMDDDD